MSGRDYKTDTEIRRRYERKRRIDKKKKRKRMLVRSAIGGSIPAIALVAAAGISHTIKNPVKETAAPVEKIKYIAESPEFSVRLLEINEYSRPGTSIDEVKGIVVHYTANPGTTARQNRDYFNGLKDSHETYASSHFVIGIAGEILQCIPCNEIAYASNERNHDTISIECCIPDDTGKFTDETYEALIELTTWLMGRYELNVEDVIRHYDVTGKSCPKYFVEHEYAWEQFHEDLYSYIDKYGILKTGEVG